MNNQIITGDCRTILQTLPSESMQTCITSPPYYGLRDYGIPSQIGLEETPDEYVAALVEVFKEVRRVLRNDGTLWLNLGDSYAGNFTYDNFNQGFNERWGNSAGEKKQEKAKQGVKRSTPDGLKPKDLIGIPWLVAFALRADGWYLRSDIIWSKPNAMPESVEDRPTKAHEYLFLLSKSERYFYDADAIREPHTLAERVNGRVPNFAPHQWIPDGNSFGNHNRAGGDGVGYNPLGRNKRSVWTVPTMPYAEAHFATFPPKLIEPCILAGSSPGDIILDCFCGAGTVPLVSLKYHRQYIGVELNPEYVTLAEKRIACVQQDLWAAS